MNNNTPMPYDEGNTSNKKYQIAAAIAVTCLICGALYYYWKSKQKPAQEPPKEPPQKPKDSPAPQKPIQKPVTSPPVSSPPSIVLLYCSLTLKIKKITTGSIPKFEVYFVCEGEKKGKREGKRGLKCITIFFDIESTNHHPTNHHPTNQHLSDSDQRQWQ